VAPDPAPDAAVESALRSLGARLDLPGPPAAAAVTGAVLARLAAPVRPVWPRRLLTAAVAAVVALATAMALSPAVRATVLDLFRIGAVEIDEHAPAPVVPPLDAPLPGERDVTLTEAAATVAFPLRLPSALGPPGTIRVAAGGQVVTMTFGTASGTASGVVRVDQFDGGLAPVFTKFAAAADVHHVTVAGVPAVWVDRPHPVFYTGRDGVPHEESARLAGSTLIWERDGVTYRVEGDLTRRRAVEIAESLF
jgi:hypothetical protein